MLRVKDAGIVTVLCINGADVASILISNTNTAKTGMTSCAPEGLAVAVSTQRRVAHFKNLMINHLRLL